MTRSRTVEVVSDLFSFAKVALSRLGSSKSTEVQLQASEDDGGQDGAEVWGDAALLSRPVRGAEALFVELGDERVVFATKDRRWQIACEEGEVVLRAMGAGSPAYVKLTPDGSAEVHAGDINLGGSASAFVALANLVNDRLETLRQAFNGHTHLTAATGSAVGPTPLVVPGPGGPVTALATVAATKVKAE